MDEETLAHQHAATKQLQEKDAEASQGTLTQSSSSTGKTVVAALDPVTQNLGSHQQAILATTLRNIFWSFKHQGLLSALKLWPEDRFCAPSIPAFLLDDMHAMAHLTDSFGH